MRQGKCENSGCPGFSPGFSGRLIERERTHYYLEQALVAMLLAGRDCAIAPASDYVTKPSETEALRPHGVMHHYVSDAKKWYFRHCWRMALSPYGGHLK